MALDCILGVIRMAAAKISVNGCGTNPSQTELNKSMIFEYREAHRLIESYDYTDIAIKPTSRTGYYIEPSESYLLYSELNEAGLPRRFNGWKVRYGKQNIWAHLKSHCNCSYYMGDKIRISVAFADFHKAYDSLAPLLFSETSPCTRWKVTDMTKCRTMKHETKRLFGGGQWTLYLYPDQSSRVFSEERMTAYRAFIVQVGNVLSQEKISVGIKPRSDIWGENWRFFSYRHEFLSSSKSEDNSHLKRHAVFRLLSKV